MRVSSRYFGPGDLQIALKCLESRTLEPLLGKWYLFLIEARAVSKLIGLPLTVTRFGYRLMRAGVLRSTAGNEGELKLFIKACKKGFCVVYIPIATRYAEGRPSSHFRPVRNT
jgi:hypothetical protein